MSSSSIGQRFVFTSFGESHGRCIGATVDGCPAGLQIEEKDIQVMLDLRKPGQSIITTQRKEDDKVEILSGVYKGYTTGAPITMIIWNKDQHSKDYDNLTLKPRPGHSDYPPGHLLRIRLWQDVHLYLQRHLMNPLPSSVPG